MLNYGLVQTYTGNPDASADAGFERDPVGTKKKVILPEELRENDEKKGFSNVTGMSE